MRIHDVFELRKDSISLFQISLNIEKVERPENSDLSTSIFLTIPLA